MNQHKTWGERIEALPEPMRTRMSCEPTRLAFDLLGQVQALRGLVVDMECNCLPHAKPGDGMCPRCEALAEADKIMAAPPSS